MIDRPLLSLSAVELFRLFPAARDTFQVGTAARVNASFPFVSPGVSLPTASLISARLTVLD